MKNQNMFEDVIIKSDLGELGIYESAHQCKAIAEAECFVGAIRLRPVAWSWFYLGEHVTTDRIRAEELLQFGESLNPLYIIVSEPC
jgi:hypothetical protein